MGERVFEEGYAVRKFLDEQNFRVVDWVSANWQRFDMDGPVDKTIISRALLGQPVRETTVKALEALYQEMRDDPWEWCKPPETVEGLARDFRPLTWWFATLKPPIPEYRFKRLRTQLLPDDMRADVQQRLDEWSSRLRAACDRFKADTRLVRAVQADERPEYQHWVDDGGWRLVSEAEFGFAKSRKLRRRVGDAGLYGCTPEEIGQAYALMDAVRPLPVVQEARLAYAQPRGVPEHDHYSEEVAPWNGDEFEGYEIAQAVIKPAQYVGDREELVTVRHHVCYWWDGERYQVEDLQKFAQVLDGDWREPTRDERDLLETGMKRERITQAEFEANREEWVERLYQSMLDEAKAKPWIYLTAPTREDAEAAFAERLARIDDEAAADERREIARLRMEFKRTLRRR